MIDVIEWVLINTIYGMIGVAFAFGGAAFLLRKHITWTPNPFTIGALVFVSLLLIAPTYPRYKFHRQVSELLEKSTYIKVINKTYWGAVTEPVTWFVSLIGSVHIVYPNIFPITGYTREILRFDEKSIVSQEEPDCENKKISIAVPVEGVYRYTVFNQRMSAENLKLFCDTDWTTEKEVLRKMVLEASKPK